MLWIGGDFECLFLVALAFEEACDLVELIRRNVREEFVGCVEIAAEDKSLVFGYAKG